jgi:hypothetical protein
MDAFRRFFPTLSEWPAEKWIGVPIALLLLIGGIVNLILGRI